MMSPMFCMMRVMVMAIVMAMERMMLMTSIVLRGENRREMSEREREAVEL